MTLKEKLYDHCVRYIEERINRIEAEIKKSQQAANEETKSSMGDKYETGRAMAQLAIEQNQIQLGEAQKLRSTLTKITNTKSEKVIAGSLVTTSKGVYYVGISLGVVNIDNMPFMIISSDSPIGKLIAGKKVGDTFQWMKEGIKIQTIE